MSNLRQRVQEILDNTDFGCGCCQRASDEKNVEAMMSVLEAVVREAAEEVHGFYTNGGSCAKEELLAHFGLDEKPAPSTPREGG